jgi:hypothetical protein
MAKRESWADWEAALGPGLPPPAVTWTRDELLAAARALGAEVAPRTLAFWEERGVVPRGVLRWEAAARGRVARYAPWVAFLVALVPPLQAAGLSLARVGERLREAAPSAMAYRHQRWQEGLPLAADPAWANAVLAAFGWPVAQAARELAARYNRLRPAGAPPIAGLRIAYLDPDGKPIGLAGTVVLGPGVHS